MPPPWAMMAMGVLGFNEAMTLVRWGRREGGDGGVGRGGRV